MISQAVTLVLTVCGCEPQSKGAVDLAKLEVPLQQQSRIGISSATHQITSMKRRLVVAVRTTKEELLRREDTDGDGLITVEDQGPKVRSILYR